MDKEIEINLISSKDLLFKSEDGEMINFMFRMKKAKTVVTSSKKSAKGMLTRGKTITWNETLKLKFAESKDVLVIQLCVSGCSKALAASEIPMEGKIGKGIVFIENIPVTLIDFKLNVNKELVKDRSVGYSGNICVSMIAKNFGMNLEKLKMDRRRSRSLSADGKLLQSVKKVVQPQGKPPKMGNVGQRKGKHKVFKSVVGAMMTAKKSLRTQFRFQKGVQGNLTLGSSLPTYIPRRKRVGTFSGGDEGRRKNIMRKKFEEMKKPELSSEELKKIKNIDDDKSITLPRIFETVLSSSKKKVTAVQCYVGEDKDKGNPAGTYTGTVEPFLDSSGVFFLPSGLGRMKLPNETMIYEGEFKFGQRSGKGKMYLISNKAVRIISQWKNDRPVGRSKSFQENGDEYVGTVKIFSSNLIALNILSFQFHGVGYLYSRKNSFLYFGSFRNNKKMGTGIIDHLSSGERYVGRFQNDKYEGRGCFIYLDGSIYNGSFSNGIKSPKGAYSLSNGFNITGDGEVTEIETLDSKTIVTEGQYKFVDKTVLRMIEQELKKAITHNSQTEVNFIRRSLHIWQNMFSEEDLQDELNSASEKSGNFYLGFKKNTMSSILENESGYLRQFIEGFGEYFNMLYSLRGSDSVKGTLLYATDDIKTFCSFVESIFFHCLQEFDVQNAEYFVDEGKKIEKKSGVLNLQAIFRSINSASMNGDTQIEEVSSGTRAIRNRQRRIIRSVVHDYVHRKLFEVLYRLYKIDYQDEEILLEQKISAIKSALSSGDRFKYYASKVASIKPKNKYEKLEVEALQCLLDSVYASKISETTVSTQDENSQKKESKIVIDGNEKDVVEDSKLLKEEKEKSQKKEVIEGIEKAVDEGTKLGNDDRAMETEGEIIEGKKLLNEKSEKDIGKNGGNKIEVKEEDNIEKREYQRINDMDKNRSKNEEEFIQKSLLSFNCRLEELRAHCKVIGRKLSNFFVSFDTKEYYYSSRKTLVKLESKLKQYRIGLMAENMMQKVDIFKKASDIVKFSSLSKFEIRSFKLQIKGISSMYRFLGESVERIEEFSLSGCDQALGTRLSSITACIKSILIEFGSFSLPPYLGMFQIKKSVNERIESLCFSIKGIGIADSNPSLLEKLKSTNFGTIAMIKAKSKEIDKELEKLRPQIEKKNATFILDRWKSIYRCQHIQFKLKPKYQLMDMLSQIETIRKEILFLEKELKGKKNASVVSGLIPPFSFLLQSLVEDIDYLCSIRELEEKITSPKIVKILQGMRSRCNLINLTFKFINDGFSAQIDTPTYEKKKKQCYFFLFNAYQNSTDCFNSFMNHCREIELLTDINNSLGDLVDEIVLEKKEEETMKSNRSMKIANKETLEKASKMLNGNIIFVIEDLNFNQLLKTIDLGLKSIQVSKDSVALINKFKEIDGNMFHGEIQRIFINSKDKLKKTMMSKKKIAIESGLRAFCSDSALQSIQLELFGIRKKFIPNRPEAVEGDWVPFEMAINKLNELSDCKSLFEKIVVFFEFEKILQRELSKVLAQSGSTVIEEDDLLPIVLYVFLSAKINHYSEYNYLKDWGTNIRIARMLTRYEIFFNYMKNLDPYVRTQQGELMNVLGNILNPLKQHLSGVLKQKKGSKIDSSSKSVNLNWLVSLFNTIYCRIGFLNSSTMFMEIKNRILKKMLLQNFDQVGLILSSKNIGFQIVRDSEFEDKLLIEFENKYSPNIYKTIANDISIEFKDNV